MDANQATLNGRGMSQKLSIFSQKLLNVTGQIWFVMAVIGQWIFAYYVSGHYGGTALKGDFEAWGEGGPHGIVPGDTIGNIAMAGHVFLAAIIMFGGPLQFIPYVRSNFPKFHKLNGKVYMITVLLTSLFGLQMIWTRGTLGGLIMQIANSFDAALIILFTIIAYRMAIKRTFHLHGRWAFRLFLVSSAVWFFRIGLMAWIFIHQSPVGFNPETLEGPFITFLAYGQYLLPLLILELYYQAKDRWGAFGKLAVSGTMIISILITGVGVFAASMILWF